MVQESWTHEILEEKYLGLSLLCYQLSVSLLFISIIVYSLFYPSQIPVNYTIYFKKAILSKVKNRFNQDNYSKTYNQISFLLYVILLKIFIYFTLVSAEE